METQAVEFPSSHYDFNLVLKVMNHAKNTVAFMANLLPSNGAQKEMPNLSSISLPTERAPPLRKFFFIQISDVSCILVVCLSSSVTFHIAIMYTFC